MRAKTQRLTRDPDRTRGCILNAAIAEFSAKGLAGARVDAIARRAGTNKRMLYHYFTDKEGLFRAVLRWKIAERGVLADSISGEPTKDLPLWFQATCQEADWVRLLGWESLQNTGEQVVEEAARRRAAKNARQRTRQRQAEGLVTSAFDCRHLLLARLSLTMFPSAFPQLTRLITGRTASDLRFQREYMKFLEKFAVAFDSPETGAQKTRSVKSVK